jgi:hypothetical protein
MGLTKDLGALPRAITVDSNNRVGIGTPAPQSIFHIGKDAPANSGEKAYTGLSASYEGFLFDYYYNTSAANKRVFDIVALGFAVSGAGGSDIRFLTVPQTTANTPVERMRISANGNVGIGAGTPLTKLHLLANSPNYILLTNTAADGVPNAIQGGIIGQSRGYGNNLAQTASILLRNENSAAWYRGEITFNTNGTDGTDPSITPSERMRIFSSGNVFIGPSPSDAGFRLDVTGTGRFTGLLNLNSGLQFRYNGVFRGQIIDYNAYGGGNDFSPFFTSETSLAFGVGGNATKALNISANGNVGIGEPSPQAKLSIQQQSANLMSQEVGSGNAQGNAVNSRIVRHYPVVSLGTKLIIPFISQGNLNSSTIVRIWGNAAMWNTRNPRAFSAEFAVGHLTILSDLTVLSSNGNISSISIAGMNIEIQFTSAYTSATANGVYVTIEYMTNVPSYSISVANITMN